MFRAKKHDKNETSLNNTVADAAADTVVQAGTVNGGVTGAHTVINQPSGPVNTGDGAQFVTTFNGGVVQNVGQGVAVNGDVHGGLTFNASDQS